METEQEHKQRIELNFHRKRVNNKSFVRGCVCVCVQSEVQLQILVCVCLFVLITYQRHVTGGLLRQPTAPTLTTIEPNNPSGRLWEQEPVVVVIIIIAIGSGAQTKRNIAEKSIVLILFWFMFILMRILLLLCVCVSVLENLATREVQQNQNWDDKLPR